MALDIGAAKKQLVGQLRNAPKVASPADLESYVGSPVPVLGLSVPTMRAILAAFAKARKRLTAAELNGLGAALWSDPVFEEKSLAILLLSRYEKTLDDDSWRLADGWVDSATGWALSDALASGPIAGMVYATPSRFRELLRWTRAKNLWRRRASTYALHRFVRAGELDKPFQLLEKLLYDEEFWVQRAVGTWLRECWKKDRHGTEAFLRHHAAGLPPVTITVATERAPKAFRMELRQKARAAAPEARRHPRRTP
jgi:3-methyladenine DNA glycosylase AlkD